MQSYHIAGRGLPKVTFWAVAEAVAVDGKTSATVAEAVAEAEGLDFNKSCWVSICLKIRYAVQI